MNFNEKFSKILAQDRIRNERYEDIPCNSHDRIGDVRYEIPRTSGRYPCNHSHEYPTFPIVKRIDFYNNRVTIVRFIDGTATKAVCSENDTFNEDTGIMVCLFKRLLSADSAIADKMFRRLMRQAKKQDEKWRKIEANMLAAEEETRRRNREANEERARRNAAKRAEWQKTVSEAIAKALEKRKEEG